ncbi:ArsA family ATPase [Candidatus Bathyarchaeota archaeon]|nr:ArsA family ATPase [Candidatus Bathyarchaeota archaeon]
MKFGSLDKRDAHPVILMFCGKGGVGKTTCASSTAIHYAAEGFKTLLISTDPAPSLTDILEVDVKGKITPIPGVENLDAVELDYSQISDMWTEKFGDEVYAVISSFLPVGKEILDYIAGAPGIDEEFSLSYVYDLYTGGKYDVIVWDTAPAGGTLSLLYLQETFYTHMRDAAKLYIRLKETLEHLTGREKRDPLKIIREWEQLAKNVLDMIRSENTTAFLVTIPEGLGVSQTERIKQDLEKFEIQIGGIIVNNLIPQEVDMSSELLSKRRQVQEKYMNILEETYSGKLPLMKLPLQGHEVIGIEVLRDIGKQLYG